MEKIKIGVIFNTHGLKGELKVKSFSDFTEERFQVGNSILLDTDEGFVSMKIISYRLHQGNALLVFEGLEDINLVEKFKGCDVYIERNQIPELDEGVYFFELKGCEVFDQNDQLLGVVEDVLETGANPVLRVNKTILIPYVPAFIKNVDIENKKIKIETIEGLV